MKARLFFIFLLLVEPVQAAGPLPTTIQIQAEVGRAAAQSQQRIDQTFDQTQRLLEDYKRTLRERQSLRSYDDHLEKMVAAQERTIASLEMQLDGVEVTHREIIPLMSRMVETLEQFVELDVPFLLNERRARVEGLKELLERPEVSVAEKYRRVMDAYQVETEYGRTIEAYRDTVRQGDQDRAADFLRVGRIALLYRSLDGGEAGVWDARVRSWQALPAEYRSSLNKGFLVAKKHAAPDLLKLPIPAPEMRP